ncbi:MAG: hypothetical protein PUK75_11715 [bacterium]|nr:hypothetical protein [bacterium]MDY4100780.1 hypothetical protein [Lachnospiraceae bacterium]
MRFLKRLFSKKRNRDREAEAFEATDELFSEEQETDLHKIGHYVLDHCEQIIESARELGEEKKEYEIVTSYLKDIEFLADLPEEQKAPIREVTENILKLNMERDQYLNMSKKISDSQYVMLEQMEEEIPDVVRRMRENETYQATIKHDMACLEGEKMQWTLLRSELMHEKYILRIASYIVFSAFFLLMILLFVLQAGFSIDITWGWIVLAALATGGGFFIFVRYQNDVLGISRAELNANHAISLLNKTKIKYVNITNAVDYACEKYHVKNARDLEYQWEQYVEETKRKERYMRTNDDLNYYNGKLLRLLEEYRLYDAKAWVDQPLALVNPGEMSEMKHNLLVRRQKLRARIQYNAKVVETERAQIDRLMALHPEYEDEIRGIIRSVDKLSVGEI